MIYDIQHRHQKAGLQALSGRLHLACCFLPTLPHALSSQYTANSLVADQSPGPACLRIPVCTQNLFLSSREYAARVDAARHAAAAKVQKCWRGWHTRQLVSMQRVQRASKAATHIQVWACLPICCTGYSYDVFFFLYLRPQCSLKKCAPVSKTKSY